MPQAKSVLLNGVCQQLLFSPKGGIEGVLLEVEGRTVQVSLPKDIGWAVAKKAAPGKRLRVLALADRSPRASAAAHPVFEYEAMADAGGQPVASPAGGDGLTAIKGKVARIHFARHGEANGVMLESGEFIHLRPHGMAALGLDVGSKVSARGEERTTVLGTPMLEAHHANGYDIE